VTLQDESFMPDMIYPATSRKG